MKVEKIQATTNCSWREEQWKRAGDRKREKVNADYGDDDEDDISSKNCICQHRREANEQKKNGIIPCMIMEVRLVCCCRLWYIVSIKRSSCAQRFLILFHIIFFLSLSSSIFLCYTFNKHFCKAISTILLIIHWIPNIRLFPSRKSIWPHILSCFFLSSFALALFDVLSDNAFVRSALIHTHTQTNSSTYLVCHSVLVICQRERYGVLWV